mgnify:CR=1 FL=1
MLANYKTATFQETRKELLDNQDKGKLTQQEEIKKISTRQRLRLSRFFLMKKIGMKPTIINNSRKNKKKVLLLNNYYLKVK